MRRALLFGFSVGGPASWAAIVARLSIAKSTTHTAARWPFRLPLGGADRALLLFSGVVPILFGIVMFAKPGAGALVVLALIAAYSLVIGASELVLAIGGKRLVEADVKRAINQAKAELRRNEPQPSAYHE